METVLLLMFLQAGFLQQLQHLTSLKLSGDFARLHNSCRRIEPLKGLAALTKLQHSDFKRGESRRDIYWSRTQLVPTSVRFFYSLEHNTELTRLRVKGLGDRDCNWVVMHALPKLASLQDLTVCGGGLTITQGILPKLANLRSLHLEGMTIKCSVQPHRFHNVGMPEFLAALAGFKQLTRLKLGNISNFSIAESSAYASITGELCTCYGACCCCAACCQCAWLAVLTSQEQ